MSEEKTGNMFIDGEDYFDGYKQKKTAPDNEALDYQALTYRLFATEEGMKWLESTRDLVSGKTIKLDSPGANLKLAESQGMIKQIIGIYKLLNTHQQYINSI